MADVNEAGRQSLAGGPGCLPGRAMRTKSQLAETSGIFNQQGDRLQATAGPDRLLWAKPSWLTLAAGLAGLGQDEGNNR